jgi:hypothetical protein
MPILAACVATAVCGSVHGVQLAESPRNPSVRNKSHQRAWIAGLVLVGVLLRGLIPTGFMPERGDDGSFSIGTCHGLQMAATSVQEEEPSAPEPAKSLQGGCVFASVQFLGSLPTLATTVVQCDAVPDLLVTFRTPAVPSGIVADSHRPRGPPSVS